VRSMLSREGSKEARRLAHAGAIATKGSPLNGGRARRICWLRKSRRCGGGTAAADPRGRAQANHTSRNQMATAQTPRANVRGKAVRSIMSTAAPASIKSMLSSCGLTNKISLQKASTTAE